MQQISTEEVKEVPFDDQINVEGVWGLKESKSVVGLQKKRRGFEMKSPDANPDDLVVRDRRNKDIAEDEVVR